MSVRTSCRYGFNARVQSTGISAIVLRNPHAENPQTVSDCQAGHTIFLHFF